jgi:small subunit ribosomal protein S9
MEWIIMEENNAIVESPAQKTDVKKKKEKLIMGIGKRKRSVAIAILKKGSGKLMINSKPLALFSPRYAKLRVEEGLSLVPDTLKEVDIEVSVKGGGIFGQADAARIAICNALSNYDKKLWDIFMAYDRSLLVPDPRRTEPHKPSRSSAGPRRKKQQSKR